MAKTKTSKVVSKSAKTTKKAVASKPALAKPAAAKSPAKKAVTIIKAAPQKAAPAKAASPKVEVKKSLSKKEVFEKLLAVARKKGEITYEELNKAIPASMGTPEVIEEALAMLEENEIDVSREEADSKDEAADGEET